jgi:hypothetical protein
MQDTRNYYNTCIIKFAHTLLWIIHKIKKIYQVIKYCLNVTVHCAYKSL